LLLKLWCKGKNFYDKGQGINAEPLTNILANLYICCGFDMGLCHLKSLEISH